MSAGTGTNVWSVVPTALWILLILSVALVFRAELRGILSVLIQRLRSGAPVKLGPIDLGADYVAPGKRVARPVGRIKAWVDKEDTRYRQRQIYYEPNRKLQLVHRLDRSERVGQLYDIQLYLIPHGDGTLACVQAVEFYFGKHWGNQIFRTTDRANAFSIATSAWGPFMCTAEIHFTDGEKVMVSRYVDFEMGHGGTDPTVRSGVEGVKLRWSGDVGESES